MKQNNPCYLFGMYERDTNSVIVNAINDTYTGTPLTISCEKCNSAVSLDTPDDIAYPDRQYGVLTHIDDFKGFLTS